MFSGCGCCGGGGDSTSALLAALLGRRKRRSTQNVFKSAGIAVKSVAGCDCQNDLGKTEKMKRNGGFRIFGPTEEELQQMKQQNQPQNPRFLAVPPSQMKMKNKQKNTKI